MDYMSNYAAAPACPACSEAFDPQNKVGAIKHLRNHDHSLGLPEALATIEAIWPKESASPFPEGFAERSLERWEKRLAVDTQTALADGDYTADELHPLVDKYAGQEPSE
jgi:hypothetical protein